MKRNKAFTLIELVSVLVILAILALIVTPLVLNIIRKAKTAADRRSVDAYGKAVELAIAAHIMDTGQIPTNLDSLEVEYNGKEVVCTVKQLKENGGLYMSQCTVNGKDVKDSNTDDGWYHYGTRDLTNEEYIDMYGDALKVASLAYYQEHNSKVSDYTTLDIDYKGKEVSCDVTINYDGTIYLENCTVAGNQEENHIYGEIKTRPYSLGEQVTYNNVDYYVINDSTESDSSVTLLKAEPLSVAEVNLYGGVGTSNNHVNMHTNASIQSESAKDISGYGGMQYYTSETCGYVVKDRLVNVSTGCTTDYAQSEIKYVVDAWAEEKVPNGLEEARLITKSEYEVMTSEVIIQTPTDPIVQTTPQFDWMCSNEYSYWIYPYTDSSSSSGAIDTIGRFGNYSIYSNAFVVRPVIVLNKSSLN